jgi:hypothetical protein
MSEPVEDLSLSMPAGCERPADDPARPGVRISELRHGRSRIRDFRNRDPEWLKWGVIGLAVLLLAPLVVWMVWSWLTALVR